MSNATNGSLGNDSLGTDTRALWWGIGFSFAFTVLIWSVGNNLAGFRASLTPDTGASYYFWQLPNPTFWSHASAWGLYLAHQISLWWFIYYAQTRVKKYTGGLHAVNVWALATNAFFIVAHLLQTHVFYDGLAQDVSIFSSQGSVIVLLVMVLIMENKRRGMFFGRPAPIAKTVTDTLRHYHGYYFAWAIVYTFWYHPMETSQGHLIGFFYMFLLLLQGSLFFTRIHLNRYWTFAQEFIVLLHAGLVAVQQGGKMWPMFAFGFAAIFVVTQMYGLGLSRHVRNAILIVYAVLAIVVYGLRHNLKMIHQVAWIATIDYLLAFVLAGLVWLVLRLVLTLKPKINTAGD